MEDAATERQEVLPSAVWVGALNPGNTASVVAAAQKALHCLRDPLQPELSESLGELSLILSRGQADRAALLGFILPGSTLTDDRVVPAFKPPFDIIRRIAQEARANQQDIKKRQPVTQLPVQSCFPGRTRTGNREV